ncbi:MAG: hypothetical protein WC859_08365 [Elusimicrobiota bacterium]|jgi:hypothetical protein
MRLHQLIALTVGLSLPSFTMAATPTAASANPSRQIQDEMEVQIKGQFKGRYLVKKIVAPVTMNLEKLQDFPEDPSQKILLEKLPIALASEFNARREVKGHAPFYPWVTPISETPFLRMTPPRDKKLQIVNWMFEVFNPQGQTIFRQRGTNGLPDEFIWEGKDSEKKFAVVDRLYSAQLTLIGPDEKATVIQGDSVILPAMAYGSEESETIEFSLSRLFAAGKSDLSLEGLVMISRFQERLRERGLTKMHVRITGEDKNLSAQRETTLVSALEKALRLAPGQIEHDSTQPTIRGEIAVFWLKTGGNSK